MKVFLSSTYEDLREHRAKAAQAIERLGQQGVRMEVFGARPVDATEVSLDEIDASDAFLGITLISMAMFRQVLPFRSPNRSSTLHRSTASRHSASWSTKSFLGLQSLSNQSPGNPN